MVDLVRTHRTSAFLIRDTFGGTRLITGNPLFLGDRLQSTLEERFFGIASWKGRKAQRNEKGARRDRHTNRVASLGDISV